jgi:hypothetical protein
MLKAPFQVIIIKFVQLLKSELNFLLIVRKIFSQILHILVRKNVIEFIKTFDFHQNIFLFKIR